jgi:hypothetical protein
VWEVVMWNGCSGKEKGRGCKQLIASCSDYDSSLPPLFSSRCVSFSSSSTYKFLATTS